MSVSFGKKTILGICEIKDIKQNKPVKATFVEFDCKDEADIKEIKAISGNWKYKKDIVNKMQNIYNLRGYKQSSASIYAMENENHEIIGIAQTKDMRPDLILDLLESSPDKNYKYVGQNMIAFLSKIALNNNFKRLYIPNPIASAKDFYLQKCGFKKVHRQPAVQLSKRGMKKSLKSYSAKFNGNSFLCLV